MINNNKLAFNAWCGCWILHNEYDPNMVIYIDENRKYTLFHFFSLCNEIPEWQDIIRTVLMTGYPEKRNPEHIKYIKHIIIAAINNGYEFSKDIYVEDDSQ